MIELNESETEDLLEILNLNKKLIEFVNTAEEYIILLDEIHLIENYFKKNKHFHHFVVLEVAEGYDGLLCTGCGNIISVKERETQEVIEDVE